MSNAKKSIANKVLAVVLSLMMLVGVIPMAALETAVAVDYVTITVTDTEGTPIEGADVAFEVDSVPNSAKTNDQGVATTVTYTDGMTFSCVVTKDGYETVTLTNAEVPADTKNITVQMTAIVVPEITDVTIEGKVLTYTGAAQEAVSVTKVDGDTITYEVDGVAADKAEVTDVKVDGDGNVQAYSILLKMKKTFAS